MPGQTGHVDGPPDSDRPASMEGRAIARPNIILVVVFVGPKSASMEGRAIARPNVTIKAIKHVFHSRFNGGPGNCPAKPLIRFGGSDLPVCGRLRAVL